MYYYLSFLRPPPKQSTPSTSVVITPQIANDLRTELYEQEQDVFYYWTRASSGTNTVPTPKTKLTTWRGQATAFKEIAVPPPRGVRDGEAWALVLTPSQTIGSERIVLGGQISEQMTPWPVMSLPVLLTTKASGGRKGKDKQEQIERLYTIRLPESEIRLSKVWDSGIGMSSWLVDLCLAPNDDEAMDLASRLQRMLFKQNPCEVLELGAGTGIGAVTCAALCSSLSPNPMQTHVLTTDLPSAIPLLEQNLATNRSAFANVSLEAGILDWDVSVDSQLPRTTLDRGVDVVLMADVTYNTASFPSLVLTLSSLLSLWPDRDPPFVLLAYKERDPAERTLWDLARGIGLHFERVGSEGGWGGTRPQVEIWIGEVRRG